MYNLKSFIGFRPTIDNAPNTVATFGELSTHSATYAKDIKIYTNQNETPNSSLFVFYSKEDGETVATDTPTANLILKMGEFLLDGAISKTLGDLPDQILQQLNAEFGTQASGIQIGHVLYDSANDIYLPEWVSFRSSLIGQDNNIIAWLADGSFRAQYDEYEIEVVPPIIPLDDFFRGATEVNTLLNNYNITEKLDEVQQERGDYPYTILKANRYDYHAPNTDDIRIPSYWIVIIYGQAGNNPDIIREHIANWVLDNSDHTRDDWIEILPDLFRSTEFVIVPHWYRYSIPNLQHHAGIYSPVHLPKEDLPVAKEVIDGSSYSPTWIEEHYETSAMQYKSLGFTVVGSPENREGISGFYQQFQDYIILPNDSADFNRISVKTQEFIVLLNRLTVVAETLTEISAIPVGISRVNRNGKLYAAASYDNTLYLVAGKRTVEDVYVDLELNGF